MLYRTKILGMVLGAAALVSFTAPAQSAVEKFYKGRSMTIFIAYAAGSTYDTYARTLARHLDRLIPGGPKIIAKTVACK